MIVIAGHRKYDEEIARREIQTILSRTEGPVISGAALGIDTWAAEEALAAGREVQFFIPYHSWMKNWTDEQRKNMWKLLSHENSTHIFVDTEYTQKIYFRRNALMVNSASKVFLFMDSEKSGTGNTYHWCEQQQKDCFVFKENKWKKSPWM